MAGETNIKQLKGKLGACSAMEDKEGGMQEGEVNSVNIADRQTKMKTENISLYLAVGGNFGKGVSVEKWEQKPYQNRLNECIQVSCTKI